MAGSTHDAHSFAELGLAELLGPGPVAADLGYLGCDGVATLGFAPEFRASVCR